MSDRARLAACDLEDVQTRDRAKVLPEIPTDALGEVSVVRVDQTARAVLDLALKGDELDVAGAQLPHLLQLVVNVAVEKEHGVQTGVAELLDEVVGVDNTRVALEAPGQRQSDALLSWCEGEELTTCSFARLHLRSHGSGRSASLSWSCLRVSHR